MTERQKKVLAILISNFLKTTGRAPWRDQLTQDEVDMLWDELNDLEDNP